jgi:hypothetical protein
MRKIEQYTQNDYTPVPTKFTIWRRTCVIWQFFQFLYVNFKMTVLILKSHH